jgi:Flp pilus assembly protein TadB
MSEMAMRATLRASDADREQIAEQLRRASTEGRIAADELEQRLEVALSARTYGQLDTLVADLPRSRPGRQSSLELGWIGPALLLALAGPVALAVVVAVIFALTGVFAAWVLWLAVGVWFFGRRRRLYGPRYARSLPPGGRRCGWHGPAAPMRPSRGSWV